MLKFNAKQKELMKKLEKEKIDFCILQTRFWSTTLQGGIFCKRHQIPSIVMEHGTSHYTQDNKIIEWILASYEHFLTRIVKQLNKDFYGVSKHCIEWLKHFHIKGKGVFYNSIDANEYELYHDSTYSVPVRKEALKILFVGRMISNKGINELVKAYQTLKQKHTITLVIAGDGPLKEKIQKENPEIILNGNLDHDEVMKLYNSCDIFVNPSYSEGLPTTVLEAGLMKCAVVATDVGGTSEIIEDKKEGLLCKPDVLDITEKLETLIQDESLRNTLGENLHEKVKEKFSWERTAEEVLKIIKE